MQRTRRALREALFAAILERGWDDVSVQDVCARANVGRSTFYTHFVDKQELLLSGFDDLHGELRALVAREGGKPLGFVRAMIEHVHEHRRLRALVGKRGGQAVLKRLTQLVVDLLEEEVAETAAPGAQRDAAVRYMAGAFVELLTWWSNTRSRLSAAELDELYRRLTLPVLRELRRGER